jgi:altronate dehydratase
LVDAAVEVLEGAHFARGRELSILTCAPRPDARRAVSQAVADKLLARLAWWEDYCRRNHAKMDNNPSSGNKAGGLTTILEKSLGAIAKSGTTPLNDVFEFAQRITTSKGMATDRMNSCRGSLAP